MDFWDFLWLFFWGFIFFAYLMVLFAIIGDIFRDPELNGWLKAVWTIFLVFLPILTALVYVIARGQGMARRQTAASLEARSEADSYIRSVAVSSPADEIARAKTLLDSGAITQSEFDALKARALGGQRQAV
jgi:vacuolar-type H+-ATPase subunit I/STV1